MLQPLTFFYRKCDLEHIQANPSPLLRSRMKSFPSTEYYEDKNEISSSIDLVRIHFNLHNRISIENNYTVQDIIAR